MEEKNRRRIFISPYQLGPLEMLSDLVNLPPVIEEFNIPKMDFQGIFFSTMFQCGVEEIALICPDNRHKNYNIGSDFLRNRIAFDSQVSKKYELLLLKVKPLFKEYYEDEKLQQNDKGNIFKAEVLLTDLLFEMQTNLSSVFISPYSKPDLKRLQVTLQPELYYPLKNLILLIESDNLNLPLPTESVLRNDVKKYEKIIESDIFSKYAATHQKLKNKQIEKSKALSQIIKNGELLQTRFNRYINLKELGITTLNMTPKCIDLFFGKIAGAATENALKLFDPIVSRFLSDNQRLVTYHFSPIAQEILNDRLFDKKILGRFEPKTIHDSIMKIRDEYGSA